MENLWNGVKKVLSTIVPIAANALIPGPGGVVAGLVADVLGVENTPEAIESALISATPEQIISLKEMEFNNQERLIELGIENDKLYFQDIQNARQREVEIVKATGSKDMNLYFLAWSIVIGFFVLLGILMGKPIPEDSNGVIFMLFGALSTGFGTVLAYFFGSSKSSTDKTKIMANKTK